jgi:medium-chain acyl-[acyl-carrier-protein] hydrolase
MGFQLTRTIDYFQSDTNGRVKLDSLMKLLQNAALDHVRETDRDSRVLIADGFAWILNKVAITIFRHPVYGQTLTVDTWHRGTKGFKSYREYELRWGEEIVAAATSSWLYLDLARRRVVKVPAETDRLYGTRPDLALGLDIEEWRPDKKLAPDFVMDITTRHSDYDMLGHVNNAAYFDYLDTLIRRSSGNGTAVKSIFIQYNKEIGGEISRVKAGLSPNGSGGRSFVIYDETLVYACGDMVLGE